MEPTHEQISRLAFQFYEEDGKPEGRSEEFWLRAYDFLSHPENHSGHNVLAPPSEPELTRALDEKARELDRNLPSDPASGQEAVHQHLEFALDPKDKKFDPEAVKKALGHLGGVERVENGGERLTVHFDARKTNPAAIHEAMLNRGYQASDQPHG